MPLFYQQSVDAYTRLAVWKITEPESFFNLRLPLKRDITHPHKRLQHMAARYLLPMLYSDFPSHEIEVADTRRPFLPAEQYHFSLSHSGDIAAAIVSSRHRVGIDVEAMNPKIAAVSHKFLHPDEKEFIHDQSAADRLTLMSIAWNAKEAMYKWYGLGGVDFSDMMRLAPFTPAQEGVISGTFQKDGFIQPLQIHYRLFDNLVLAWISG